MDWVSGGWQPLTRLFNGPKVHHYTDCAPSRFQLGAGRRRRGGPFGFAQRRLRPPLTHSIAGNRRGLVHLASAARRSLPVRLSGRLLRVVGRVLLNKLFLVVWDVFECMNRVGGAGRDAGTAVDAAPRIDVHLGRGLEAGLVLLGMDAIGWANFNTEGVFDTGISNYISHDGSVS